MGDQFTIAGRTFRSRLMIGTGKYRSFPEMVACHEASGAEMVTVAVRRVNLTDKTKESLLDYIDRKKFFMLPNTAACYNVDDAVRTARLGREVGLSELGEAGSDRRREDAVPRHRRAAGSHEDAGQGRLRRPALHERRSDHARKLIDAGAAAVMPLAAPIGSGLGIQNYAALRILRELITEVPLIVDAGVGTASDAVHRDGDGRRRRADEHGDRGGAGLR